MRATWKLSINAKVWRQEKFGSREQESWKITHPAVRIHSFTHSFVQLLLHRQISCKTASCWADTAYTSDKYNGELLVWFTVGLLFNDVHGVTAE